MDSRPHLRRQILRASGYYRTLDALRRNIRIRHIMTLRNDVYSPKHDMTAKSVLTVMTKMDFDMAPIFNRSGQVSSYVLRTDLEANELGSDRVSKYARPLGLDRIISSSTSILDELDLWEQHSYYLVISSNELAGIVTYADLNKVPVRLVFYTILSEIETKLRKLIRRKMPNDGWMTFLNNSTKGRIESYNEADRRLNLVLNKTVYLMFSELLSLFDNEGLYQALGYKRKQDYVDSRKEVNDFRNSIMHSKPLVTPSQKLHPTLGSKLAFLLQFANRIPVKNV